MATYNITANDRYQKISEKGQTFCAYRVKVDQASSFVGSDGFADELEDPGVYLLIRDVDGELPQVYVGEAEPLGKRIKQHIADRNKGKEFPWTEAILFVNIANEWMKNDIKFIENGIYDALVKANRYGVVNATTPTKSKVSDRALCNKHIEAIKALSTWYGHPKLFLKFEKGAEHEEPIAAEEADAKFIPSKTDWQFKIGKVVQVAFPMLFSKKLLTREDLAFLTSHAASEQFNNGNQLTLKEYHGDPEELKNATGKVVFYSEKTIPALKAFGKEYVLTNNFYPPTTEPVEAWIEEKGLSKFEVNKACYAKFGEKWVIKEVEA